ncbi:MAG: SCP2 sterol-binding domain-containing protein [Chloroflexi bacterium]|jgi:putative sterol carrier protein|nr:SCP2 sterol-binding domain-containing protein [Chloroflexota bacterium]
MPLTIADLMSKMPGAFLPEKAPGLEAVIQFHFTGNEAGDWYAEIKDGKVTVHQGVHPSPRMTLTADSSDYIKIFTGELDGMRAFMEGKLKLSGDLNLAMKLTQMFRIR